MQILQQLDGVNDVVNVSIMASIIYYTQLTKTNVVEFGKAVDASTSISDAAF